MNVPFKVTFNGYELTNIMRIGTLDRGIRLGVQNEYQSRKRRKGFDHVGFSSGMVSFAMTFRIWGDLVEAREVLADVLSVTEPKELTFSDEPGRVYYATPTADIDLNEIGRRGTGTIVWEIPDGAAYSPQSYIYTNKNADSTYNDYISITNPGTETIDLELTANFRSDNGFLGVEADKTNVRALFGDMEEIDGFDYEISEKLFDDHLNVTRGWTLNNGVIPPVTPSITQQGTFGYKQEVTNEGFAYPTSYGTATASWNGPSLTKVVPADSNGEYAENWSSAFRSDFNTDGAAQLRASLVGHQSISYIDQNNNIIVSIVIEDNTPSSEKSDLAIYIRNKRVYDSRNTTSYYVTARPGDVNHVNVKKIGNKITVEAAFIGKKLSFDLNEPGIFLRKITFYAARYKNLSPMRNNLLRAINVTKHNVEKWEDVPNKFMNGDILKYGKSIRNVYCTLNEMNALEIRDVGSTTISAPPGDSLLYIAYSSFSQTPEVTAKGRAKYIL